MIKSNQMILKRYARLLRPAFLLLYMICAALPGTAQSYIEYVDSADHYIKLNKWEDAERATIAALRKMPANKLNYLLWSNLGEIRTRLGRLEDALQAFDIGLASQPRNVDLLNKRAATYLELGMDSLARCDIDSSLNIDSVQRWPLRARGLMRLSNRQYELAETDLKNLVKHFPLDDGAYKGLGQIEAIKGNSDKAIEYYDRALDIHQDDETWFYKITVKIDSGKTEQAEEDLRNALKRFPRCGNLFLLRGLIHKLKFQNEAAMIDRKLAIEYGSDPLTVEKILPRETK